MLIIAATYNAKEAVVVYTYFVLCAHPSNAPATRWHLQAMQHFLQSLSPPAQHALSANSSLADALVSGHLVSGVALGSKALEALLPEGELNSQAGAVLQVQQQSR